MSSETRVPGGAERLTPELRDTWWDALRQRYPDAVVAAIEPTGVFTEMPPSVELTGQPQIRGPRSALQLVTPRDRDAIIDTWSRALEQGAANGQARFLGNQERTVRVYFVDLTHRFGVYIGLFQGLDPTALTAAGERAAPVPRTCVLRKDALAVITGVDGATQAMLGWAPHEMIGHRALEFMHPDDEELSIANWMDMLSRPGSSHRLRLRHRHRNGSYLWVEITNHNHLGDSDDPHVLADIVDVTEQVNTEEALRASEQLLRRLTDAMPVGVLGLDANGLVTYSNRQLGTIVGTPLATTADEQLANAIAPDRDRLRAAFGEALRAGNDADIEASFQLKDELRRCIVSLRGLTNEAGAVTGVIACVWDITEAIELREALRRRASYDLLTGCLNHASAMEALNATLATAAEHEWVVALFIDVDDFKGINDRYGHLAGDEVLTQLADRMRRVARADDLVGRLGGDEFVVVVRVPTDVTAVARVTERVAAGLAGPVDLGTQTINPKVSIGVAYAPTRRGVTADTLISAADTAMYESKRDARALPVIDERPVTAQPPMPLVRAGSARR